MSRAVARALETPENGGAEGTLEQSLKWHILGMGDLEGWNKGHQQRFMQGEAGQDKDHLVVTGSRNTAPPPSESRVPTRPWTPQLLASQVLPQSLRWSWQEKGHLPDLPRLVGAGRAVLLGRQRSPTP